MRSSPRRSRKLVAHLGERPLDPLLDGALILAEHPRDVLRGQVGAEAQGYQVALGLAERRHGAGDRVALLDFVALACSRASAGAADEHVLHCALLDALPARMVAPQVDRDRIKPRA